QRGEALGAVLQALLDEGTWTVTEESGNGAEESGNGAEESGNGAEESGNGAAQPAAELEEQDEAAEQEKDEEAAEPVAEAAPVEEAPAGEAPAEDASAEHAPAEGAPVVPVPTEPVLEMLAAREGVRGPGADDADEDDRESRRGVVAIAVASFVAAVIGGAAAFVGLSQWDAGGGGGTASAQPQNESMKHFVPQLGGPFEAPFPSDPEPLSCF